MTYKESIITYDFLSQFKEIVHFSTTRHGGVSVGNFSSFNVSPFTADNPQNVFQNQQILSNITHIEAKAFVFPYQTHDDKVLVLQSDFEGLPAVAKNKLLQGVDALITNQKSICIGVTTADCVPIFLFDKAQKVIATVHAGWRGTRSRLLQKTISTMQTHFGTRPSDVFALIGPSISGQAYHVGSELIAEFEKAAFPVEMIFEQRNDKLFLDLWEANRYLLLQAGVPDAQISISGICTYTAHDDFFSARRLQIKSGRIYNAIMLK